MSDEYEILPDENNIIAKWVCDGLGENADWLDTHTTYGFAQGGKMLGGLIFHSYRPNVEVWWTVYTVDKRWCNRRMLRAMFDLAFNKLKCRRISLLVSKSNAASLNFVKKLGFQQKGMFRAYRENGDDCCIFGMLKNECKWI